MKPQTFAARMGFDRVAVHAPGGVVADWTQLPNEIRPFRVGFKHAGGKAAPTDLPGGAVSASWLYESKTDRGTQLVVEVTRCAGQAQALTLLDRLGNSSNMKPSPFGPAPAELRLGDFTAVAFPAKVAASRATDHVFWVYRNMVVRVRVTGPGKRTVFALAHAIQSFMERHLVQELAAQRPGLPSLTIEPQKATVGGSFKVAFAGQVPPGWTVTIRDLQGDVRLTASDATSAVFSVRGPGTVEVEALLVDGHTLLSVRHRGSVEVVAARP